MSQTKITDKSLLNNAVISSKIVDGAVTSSKIANNAVTSSKILDGAVTSSKIDGGAVTSSKIEDYSISQTKISSGTVFRPPNTRVYRSNSGFNTSLDHSTSHLIDFGSESWDTYSDFTSLKNTSTFTNYFNPKVEGFYLIIVNVAYTSNANLAAEIWKNGYMVARGNMAGDGTNRDLQSNVFDIVYLNGGTDFVQGRVYHQRGSKDVVVTGASNRVYMNAFQVSLNPDVTISPPDDSATLPTLDSPGGGTKVVCTAMNEDYGFGSYRNAIWLKYAELYLTKEHEIGYHTIFKPLLKIRHKYWVGRQIYKILKHIARHRSIDLRAEMQGKKRNTIGRIWRLILEPLCYIVGKTKLKLKK